MSEKLDYKQKINKILDGINPGNAKFTLFVSDRYIKPNDGDWESGITEEGFLADQVKSRIVRHFNPKSKKWMIDRGRTISKIEHSILGDAHRMFMRCSPNMAPRRTKAYKNFRKVVNETKDVEFVNSIFDITEYCETVTKTDSIQHTSNSVHRKNIYQLLCLMEKNYGSKREENSN